MARCAPALFLSLPMSTDRRATLGGVSVGDGLPVVVMGALNVSPESFYQGSVHREADALLRAAVTMVEAGAAVIDVGARSTAPYLPTDISDEQESRRLGEALQTLAPKLPVPISADTTRPRAARVALEAGARILNDVSGLADIAMARLAAEHDASLIVMASPRRGEASSAPLATVRARLAEALERAMDAGLPGHRVVLDPGIGFFRDGAVDWVSWDIEVLARLDELAHLGRPLCIGVSRKSFLGALTGHPSPADRLSASLAATTVAVLHGAAVIRTHDVAATRDAVRVAERFRESARP
jgi:dihydropteroate synthase